MRSIVLLLFAACALQAQDSTQPGKFHVEHPTLLNLGFEWAIDGDTNRNATVEVRFRKEGTTDWQQAMPLLRIGGERVYREQEGVKECLFTSYRQKPAVSRQTDAGWSWKRLGNERHRAPDRVAIGGG